MGAVAPLALDEAFSAGPKSYAELCRMHIATFMQGVDRCVSSRHPLVMHLLANIRWAYSHLHAGSRPGAHPR